MRIAVFGAGYVGLVTGTCLSELGHEVTCIDIDAKRIDQLREGRIPIYEPGLAELIRRNTRAGRLHFAMVIQDAVPVDVIFIAVGTPPGKDGSADISAVIDVAKTIKTSLRLDFAEAPDRLVVAVKSTVPVGTCDRIQELLGSNYAVVSNPEFLKEGDAIQDFFKPDRIVIGSADDAAKQCLRALYAPLQLAGERVVLTDTRSSELIKYASNTMLAMRISFMNEMSRLCHVAGANVHDVRLGVGSDSRIGRRFLYAGPGWGGSCFGKDVSALTYLGLINGIPMRMARATQAANEEQAMWLSSLVYKPIKHVEQPKVAIWGLAFKPGTDDVREAPAIRLAHHMLSTGASIVGHDPEAGDSFLREMGLLSDRLMVANDQYKMLDGAHVLVLMTEWRCYMAPSFDEILARMATGATIIDARNIWSRAQVEAVGLKYVGLGT